MSRPRIILTAALTLLLLVIGALALVGFGAFTGLSPQAPSAWHGVHIGMSRSNILLLVGPSPTSAFPEKIREAWDRENFFGIRRLVVVYGNEPGDETATYVEEYIYWRPGRREITTRREP